MFSVGSLQWHSASILFFEKYQQGKCILIRWSVGVLAGKVCVQCVLDGKG